LVGLLVGASFLYSLIPPEFFGSGKERSKKVCDALLKALKSGDELEAFLLLPDKKLLLAALKSKWQAFNSTKLGKVKNWDTGGGTFSYFEPKYVVLKYILYAENSDSIGNVRFTIKPIDKTEKVWRVSNAEWEIYGNKQ
jgi:hypothetical protein